MEHQTTQQPHHASHRPHTKKHTETQEKEKPAEKLQVNVVVKSPDHKTVVILSGYTIAGDSRVQAPRGRPDERCGVVWETGYEDCQCRQASNHRPHRCHHQGTIPESRGIKLGL